MVYEFNFVISAHSRFVNILRYGYGQRRTMIDDNALNEMMKNFKNLDIINHYKYECYTSEIFIKICKYFCNLDLFISLS